LLLTYSFGTKPFNVTLETSLPVDEVLWSWCKHPFNSLFVKHVCLQCFDTVGWAAGRASGL